MIVNCIAQCHHRKTKGQTLATKVINICLKKNRINISFNGYIQKHVNFPEKKIGFFEKIEIRIWATPFH